MLEVGSIPPPPLYEEGDDLGSGTNKSLPAPLRKSVRRRLLLHSGDRASPSSRWAVAPRKPIVSVPGVLGGARTYGHTDGATPVVEPYTGFARSYQDHVRLPGTVFGIVRVARRCRSEATAPAMIVVPPFTSPPAVPLACLVAVIAPGRFPAGRPGS